MLSLFQTSKGMHTHCWAGFRILAKPLRSSSGCLGNERRSCFTNEMSLHDEIVPMEAKMEDKLTPKLWWVVMSAVPGVSHSAVGR